MSVKFPWLPLASAAAAALGLFGLYWYETLPPEQQAEADALAVEYAQVLYGRALGELTADETSHVTSLVKARISSH